MLNKAILLGRLTKDPSITKTSEGKTVARFTLAVDRRFNRSETDFLNIVTFGSTADFVEKYFSKGQLVFVVGAIQTRSWEKDGQRQYVTEIIADEVGFGGSKKDDGQTVTPTKDAADQTAEGFEDVDDDDLPF